MQKYLIWKKELFIFAKDVYLLCKKVKGKLYILKEYIDQLIRASASVGANYREANEALGKKDFVFRIKISRKEAKESTYFLRLLKQTETIKLDNEFDELIIESIELTKIFSTILEKSK